MRHISRTQSKTPQPQLRTKISCYCPFNPSFWFGFERFGGFITLLIQINSSSRGSSFLHDFSTILWWTCVAFFLHLNVELTPLPCVQRRGFLQSHKRRSLLFPNSTIITLSKKVIPCRQKIVFYPFIFPYSIFSYTDFNNINIPT